MLFVDHQGGCIVQFNVFSDAPDQSRKYCPGCEPDADPMEEILDVRWCEEHSPDRDGVDDEKFGSHTSGYHKILSDAEMNRGFTDLLHRGKLPT